MKYAVLDFETTGFDPKTCEITEVGIVIADENFHVVSEFQTFVNILGQVPEHITELTGINQSDVDNGMGRTFAATIVHLLCSQPDLILVCQHAPFDISFLEEHYGVNPQKFVCTRTLSSIAEPYESASLTPVCERLGIKLEGAHRSINDCYATLEVLKKRIEQGVYIENSVVESVERPLKYLPKYTEHIYDLDDLKSTAPDESDLEQSNE